MSNHPVPEKGRVKNLVDVFVFALSLMLIAVVGIVIIAPLSVISCILRFFADYMGKLIEKITDF